MQYFYKIADIVFCIEGDWPKLGQSRLKKYLIDAPADGKYDVRYKMFQECEHIEMPDLSKAVEVNKRHWLKRDDGGYTMIDWIPEFSEKVLNRIDANADWSEIEVRLCCEDFSGLDKNFRAFNAFGEMLHYVLFARSGIAIHSSCIKYADKTVLFSAPSGTGKSTHTRLWKKYYPDTVIINDDLPALRIFEDGDGNKTAYAYGTPWAGKTQTHENEFAPVRAIVFLKQAKENSIRKVSGAEAAVWMLHSIRTPVLPDCMHKSLDMVSKFLETVPVYELSCDISQEAVETVKNELFR